MELGWLGKDWMGILLNAIFCILSHLPFYRNVHNYDKRDKMQNIRFTAESPTIN